MENGRIVEQTTAYNLFARPQSDMATRLVNRFLTTQLPDDVIHWLANLPGRILTLKYQGDDSLNPIITEIAATPASKSVSYKVGLNSFIIKPLAFCPFSSPVNRKLSYVQ